MIAGTDENAAVESSLQLVRRFVTQCHPAAEAALLAGSRARRSGAADSDHDVVLLFASLPNGAWREMVLFEGHHIEAFAQDLGTLAYFCREVDRPSGRPVLTVMIAEGIAALSKNSALLEAARKIANETLRLGPPPLDAPAIRQRCYAITDLATKLRPDGPKNVLLAAGATLYCELADFALRANGHWSATGKAVPRALAMAGPGLAEQFETAFRDLFTNGQVAPVQALVDAVLQPHGGRLREGYLQTAPAAWTDTPANPTQS